MSLPMVNDIRRPLLLRAMRATEIAATALHAMADNFAATPDTLGSERLNCAFKRIKCVRISRI